MALAAYGIAANGKTVDPIVVDSDPPFVFEGTALRAVRQWVYKARRDADPAARSVIRIVFRPTVDPQWVTEPGATAEEAPSAPEAIGTTSAP